MKYDCVIGIDPGSSGGISIIYKDLDRPITLNMPNSVHKLKEILEQHKEKNPIVFIEKVSMWVDDNDPEKKGKQFRITKMLSQYKETLTTIRLSDIDIIEVYPRQWLKKHGLKSIKNRTERKNRNKRHANYFYPGLALTHATADAVLLMVYGMLMMEGEIMKPKPKKKPNIEQGKLFLI